MASMRAEAVASDRIAAAPETPDVLAVAAALRWERPDLTGQLADHVLAAADAAGDRDRLAVGGRLGGARPIGDRGRPRRRPPARSKACADGGRRR